MTSNYNQPSAPKFCSKCGAPIAPGQKFCSKCGTRFEQPTVPAPTVPSSKFCSKCGTKIEPGQKFCSKCGNAISTTAPAAVAKAPEPTPVVAPKPAPVISQPSSKFCSKCGTKIEPGQKFCSKCGNAISAAAPATVAKAPEPVAAPIIAPVVTQATEPSNAISDLPDEEVTPDEYIEPDDGYIVDEDGFIVDREAEKMFEEDANYNVDPDAKPAPAEDDDEELPDAPDADEILAGLNAGIETTGDGSSGTDASGRKTTDSPGKILLDELKNRFKAFGQLFKDKKKLLKVLLAAGGMVLTWLVTMIIQKVLADKFIFNFPFVVKLLAFLSFANGGISNNPLYMIGGIFGKLMFATSIISMILDGIKRPKKGISEFFGSFKKLNEISNIAVFIIGAGGAMVAYNFFCGSVNFSLSMVGFASIVSMICAGGGGVQLIRRLIESFTADVDKTTKVRYVNDARTNAVISGAVIGFATGILLSFIPFGFTPYIFGALCILVGFIMLITTKNNTARNVATMLLIMTLLSLVIPMAIGAESLDVDAHGLVGVLKAGSATMYFDPNVPGDYEHVKAIAMVIATLFGIPVTLIPATEPEPTAPSYRLEVINVKRATKLIMGDTPVQISAMVIVTDPTTGKSMPDMDLTSRLTISGTSPIYVASQGIRGQCKVVNVSIPKSKATDLPSSGSVTVKAPVDGLSQTLAFEIIGNPKIEFIEKEYWQKLFSLNAMWGDGATYDIRIRIRYLLPEDVPEFSFSGSGISAGFDAECTKDDFGIQYYTIKLTNNTRDKLKKETKSITMSMKVGDRSAEASFNLVIYHKGLTVTASKDSYGRIALDTREKDTNTEAKTFKSVKIRVSIVVPDENGRALVLSPNDCRPEFDEKLIGEGNAANAIDKITLKTNIKANSPGDYYLTPDVTLPHPKSDPPYVGKHTVKAVWNGETYEEELTYTVIGVESDPMADVKREIENIKKIMRILGISGETRKLIRQDLTKLSVHELCLIRKAIFEAGVEACRKDAAELIAEGNRMDKYVTAFGIAKFCGDQAFSILITYYFSDIADAIVTPWKELVVDYIAQKNSAAEWGYNKDYGWEDFAKTTAASCENYFSKIIEKEVVKEGFIKGDLLNLKKTVGRMVAGWLAVSTLKHYYTSDKKGVRGSWMSSIWEAAKDLTTGGIKILIATNISDWLTNSPTANAVKKKLENWMSSCWPNFFTTEVAKQCKDATGNYFWDNYRIANIGEFIKKHPEFAAKEGKWGAEWIKNNIETVSKEQVSLIESIINQYASEIAKTEYDELLKTEAANTTMKFVAGGVQTVVDLANMDNMYKLVNLLMKNIFNTVIVFPSNAPAKPGNPEPNMQLIEA